MASDYRCEICWALADANAEGVVWFDTETPDDGIVCAACAAERGPVPPGMLAHADQLQTRMRERPDDRIAILQAEMERASGMERPTVLDFFSGDFT